MVLFSKDAFWWEGRPGFWRAFKERTRREQAQRKTQSAIGRLVLLFKIIEPISILSLLMVTFTGIVSSHVFQLLTMSSTFKLYCSHYSVTGLN